ncbi:MAG: hypothetical protein AM325_003590 [Candidatus Thorarchaeota archaeon SMTZ1-45]|nr:MAG: hypothetical protein AM325_05365 [Candidatus Thorarchaeota archaeon SMTZ1-45]
MVVGYEVLEDGTLNEVELSKDDLDSTKVVCVVDDETKSIYLWKGTQAGIRRKFIGARVATNLRTEYGFHFKVRPLDEGEEPPTFFTALNGTTAAERVLKPGEPAPPPKPPKPKTEPTAEPTPSVSAPPKPQPTEPTPQPTTASMPPPRPPTATPTTSPRPPTTSMKTAPSAEIQAMISELETVDPPEGYQRELLIVYNELFTVAEHKITVFGQEKVERKFEKVRDPPEGTFMAEGFIPRVIVKDGRVLGIELLKGTPDAILSPIKAEMKERLGDLISFFRSELEEESEADAKKKGKAKGKKLVAK